MPFQKKGIVRLFFFYHEIHILGDLVKLNMKVVTRLLAALLYSIQICISFALHRGMGVIPGTVIPEQIVENTKATELQLDQDDMDQLLSIDKNLKFIDVSSSP